MEERELVKIKSNNPAHPKGYYIQFKDNMKPGDVIYGAVSEVTVNPETGYFIPPVIPKPAVHKPIKRKVRK